MTLMPSIKNNRHPVNLSTFIAYKNIRLKSQVDLFSSALYFVMDMENIGVWLIRMVVQDYNSKQVIQM